ncbi:MAG: hypothetical protein HHJ15_16805 [Rhodoferax sp.]|nr:hypothetical protein [Rhodoferax sp.]
MNAEQLRELIPELIAKIAQQSQMIAVKDSDILYRQAKIDKLTHELATLKRWKFGRSSELLNAGQVSLLDETIDADIAAIEQELKALAPTAKTQTQPRQQPKRAALPAGLPRVEIRHDPDTTTCGCGCQLKRIGEDVSEKLDYTPGVFTVEQHIRGKWACAQCETLIQAPVPAQIIDLGHPHCRLTGPGAGGQIQRPFAAVPAGTHFWTCRCGAAALDPGAMGGHLWRAIAAAGGCTQGRNSQPRGLACRRDAGGDAQTRQQKNTPGLSLGLCARSV